MHLLAGKGCCTITVLVGAMRGARRGYDAQLEGCLKMLAGIVGSSTHAPHVQQPFAACLPFCLLPGAKRPSAPALAFLPFFRGQSAHVGREGL